MDNLNLYNKFKAVPEEAKRKIEAGRLRGFTDINPMWRIKALTEQFGPCGIGWWYTIEDKQILKSEGTGEIAVFVDVILYYLDPETKEPSKGVPGTGGSSFVAKEKSGLHMSDECFKMATTDAVSVAAKALGVGADVYYEKDRSKYNSPEPEEKLPTKFVCEKCGNPLNPYANPDGKRVSVKKHVDGSKEKFGKVLCIDCIRGDGSNE